MLPLKRIHFIGVGGVGMSAIAWVLLKKTIPVSGSDIRPTPLSTRLENNGAKIYYGHSESNLDDVGLVVISSAIGEENPELKYARKKGIPVWHRSRMLAEILDEGKAICIAGTHGKTTTTALVSLIVEKAGLDPTVLVGGVLPEIGGNARLGHGPYIVAEADESDGTFLNYSPRYAVITNIEPEHLDFYKTGKAVQQAFRSFLDQVHPKGYAVVCWDDPGIRSILDPEPSCGVCLYSLESPHADYYGGEIRLFPRGSVFTVFLEGRKLGRIKLGVPGRHNISNALSAISLGHILGIDFEVMQGAIEDFRGPGRRFQVKGEEEGILVIDDYAHHPTEVAATLRGALPLRESREGRLITVFQPHRFTRTRDLAGEFAKAFHDSDIAIITDVYPAGESPIKGVSGKLIFDGLEKNGHPDAIYVPNLEEISGRLLGMVAPGDIVITMGAGNIWKIGENLLCELKGQKLKFASLDKVVKV